MRFQLLQQHNAHISMTQNGDPYENAIAERVNGILKTELISKYYDNIDSASIHITRCITIYNYRRRHSSLNWQIPNDVHQQQGPQIRRWKNYYQNNSKPKPIMPETWVAYAQKIVVLAVGLHNYFFANTPSTTFLINLIQDDLS